MFRRAVELGLSKRPIIDWLINYYTGMGREHLVGGRLNPAKQMFSNAIGLKPFHIDALIGRAEVHAAQGDLASLRTDLETLDTLNVPPSFGKRIKPLRAMLN
jgi:hypothetical protein